MRRVFEVTVMREDDSAAYNVIAADDVEARALAVELDNAAYAGANATGTPIQYCESKLALELDK